jgi:hypothetical protein
LAAAREVGRRAGLATAFVFATPLVLLTVFVLAALGGVALRVAFFRATAGGVRFRAVAAPFRATGVAAVRFVAVFLRAADRRAGACRLDGLVRRAAGRLPAGARLVAGRRVRAGEAAARLRVAVFFLLLRARAMRGRDGAFLAAMKLLPLCPVDPGPLSRG